MLTALWFTGSRSGWVTLVVLATFAVWLRSTGVRELGAACGIALIAILSMLGLSVVISSSAVISSFGLDGVPINLLQRPIMPSPESTLERWLSIKAGLELFSAHPIFGAGLGAFRELGFKAQSQLALLIHSTPVWLLAETGIVGLFAFAGPAIALFAQEIRRPIKDDAAKIVLLCLAVLGTMSIPADMLYQRTFWLLFGAALAMPYIRKRHQSA
jgi:O-antigen ligase